MTFIEEATGGGVEEKRVWSPVRDVGREQRPHALAGDDHGLHQPAQQLPVAHQVKLHTGMLGQLPVAHQVKLDPGMLGQLPLTHQVKLHAGMLGQLPHTPEAQLDSERLC